MFFKRRTIFGLLSNALEHTHKTSLFSLFSGFLATTRSMLFLLFCFYLLVVSGEEEYLFWEACEKGDVMSMGALSDKVDVNFEDEGGRTPLLLTILHRRREATRWLVKETKVDVDLVGRWPGPRETPFAVAAAMGDVVTMEILVEAGANVNFGEPLVAAAAQGQTEALKFLLGVGAEIDRQREGASAAALAASGCHPESLEVLLDHGASLKGEDTSLLHLAAQAESIECVKILLERGADPEGRSQVLRPAHNENPSRDELRGGLTPLMSAAAAGNLEAVKLLVKNVNAFDASGMNAMAWACQVPNGQRTTEILVELHRNNSRDDSLTLDGRFLMHVAAESGNARAIAWLVDIRNHPVDLLSAKKQTPLFCAVTKKANKVAINALLRRGADVNYRDPKDKATPLIAAVIAGDKLIVKLLLKHGADPLLTLATGEFPSQLAPKTPQGRQLKFALSKAERAAYLRLHSKDTTTRNEPPAEEVGETQVVEDLFLEDDEEDPSSEQQQDEL